MDVSFERGDPRKPKGHALAYFRSRSEPDKVYATYIIVLPISVDFAKYVPPFLANHLGSMSTSDLAAFSLPPVPEEMAGYAELQRLAELRDDDLLCAGTMYSQELPEMMQAVTDVVRQYADAWTEHSKQATRDAEAQRERESPSVNEVLFSLMSERDRLAELSKLVGKLRFAVEGNDRQTGGEIEDEILILDRYLPEQYYIPSLLQAVSDSAARGAQLAELYLDRCYKLCNGDEPGVRDLERRIEMLKAPG